MRGISLISVKPISALRPDRSEELYLSLFKYILYIPARLSNCVSIIFTSIVTTIFLIGSR
ncbi:protein of unknown function [Alcaligenes faecalis subsp. faecalis]|nr:protein of unknown function [Alcaligenes faecalis subsp. faecalis]